MDGYMDLRDVKMKDLPPKKKGRHRFIAIASFVTSDEAIRKGYSGEEQAIFDSENLWDFNFGCIDCEQPWHVDMRKFCDAPEYIDPNEEKRRG